jgi:hypothetical protein
LANFLTALINIESLLGVSQVFHLTWLDVMLILGQILMTTEKEAVLSLAAACEDELLDRGLPVPLMRKLDPRLRHSPRGGTAKLLLTSQK